MTRACPGCGTCEACTRARRRTRVLAARAHARVVRERVRAHVRAFGRRYWRTRERP